MDLIGNIKYVGNMLGRRKTNYSKGKSAQKNTRIDTAGEINDQADANHFSTEKDSRIGQKVDTTA